MIKFNVFWVFLPKILWKSLFFTPKIQFFFQKLSYSTLKTSNTLNFPPKNPIFHFKIQIFLQKIYIFLVKMSILYLKTSNTPNFPPKNPIFHRFSIFSVQKSLKIPIFHFKTSELLSFSQNLPLIYYFSKKCASIIQLSPHFTVKFKILFYLWIVLWILFDSNLSKVLLFEQSVTYLSIFVRFYSIFHFFLYFELIFRLKTRFFAPKILHFLTFLNVDSDVRIHISKYIFNSSLWTPINSGL